MRTVHITSLVVAAGLLVAPRPALAQDWAHELRASIRAVTSDLSREMNHFYQEKQGPETTDKFSRTFKVAKGASLDLANLSGDVVVTVGTGGEIVIDAVKRVRGRDGSTAKQQLDAVRIEAAERAAGRIEVRTIYPERLNSRVSVNFAVRVPADAAVTLKSISGDVRVTGVAGELRAETVSGNVTATDAARLSLAKSVSGDVSVSGVSTDGPVTLGSVSGDLLAKGLKAKSLDAGTVSGNVTLSGATLDRVTAKSISGDIVYDGSLNRGGHYELKAHSGDVRLTIADGVGFELDASSFSGNVRSDMPVTMKSFGSEDRRSRRTLRGSFGDGSAYLQLTTFSGDIVIAKR